MQLTRFTGILLVLTIVFLHCQSAAVSEKAPKCSSDDSDRKSPAPSDCTCSFEECCCKDKTEKKSSDDWVDDLIEDITTRTTPKTREPKTTPEPSTEPPQKGYFDSDEEEEGSEDPDALMVERKQTFEEYYQNRRKQEIQDFKDTFYSKKDQKSFT